MKISSIARKTYTQMINGLISTIINCATQRTNKLAASNHVKRSFNKIMEAYNEVAIVSKNSVETVNDVPCKLLESGIKDIEPTLKENINGIIASNNVHCVSLLEIKFINAIGACLTLLAQ
jgi:hypothetical protein